MIGAAASLVVTLNTVPSSSGSPKGCSSWPSITIPARHSKWLLAIIARHLDDAERARSAERRVRAGNAANRLLRQIPRKPEPPVPSLRELLANE